MSDETSAEQTPEKQPDLLEQVEGRLDQDDGRSQTAEAH